jgi:hypothetical protein
LWDLPVACEPCNGVAGEKKWSFWLCLVSLQGKKRGVDVMPFKSSAYRYVVQSGEKKKGGRLHGQDYQLRFISDS